MTAPEARRWIVAGRVQGVGFRFFVLTRALRHGVAGWVRNLADGRVEVLARGSRAAVDLLAADLAVGPPHAQVATVTVAPVEAGDEFPDPFAVR